MNFLDGWIIDSQQEDGEAGVFHNQMKSLFISAFLFQHLIVQY